MKKLVPEDSILLPKDAKIVFEGQIFSVYQWEQDLFDGTKKTFEMLRRADTVQVIAVRGRQILLVHDEQPGRPVHIHFPGGRVDDTDESWLIAAQRELSEETGLVCNQWKLVDVQQPQTKIEWFTPIFLATDITDQLEQQLDVGGERISLDWQDFEAVRDKVLSGEEQMMQYLIPFFNRVTTIEQLLNLTEFIGEEIER